MPERQALAIVSFALLLMALAVIRPSSGMRMVVLGLLLAAAVLVCMSLGLRDLLSTFGGS